jgi:ubiquitin C-terminal hydrolase
MLAELFSKARASHNHKTVSVSAFLRLLMAQSVQYTQLRAYSPFSFFKSLLQALHRELNLVKEPGPTPVLDFNQRSTVAAVAADYLQAVKRSENSAIRDYFGVQLTALRSCKVCGHKTFINSIEYCLALPVPDTDVWRYLDLYHCLEAALGKRASPQDVCPNCMRRGPIEVQTFLTRLPPLLVFYFDRSLHLTLDLDTELTFPVTNLDLRVYGPSISGRYCLYSAVGYLKPSSPAVLAS